MGQGSPLSLESCFPELRKILNPKSSRSQKHIFDSNLKSSKADLKKSGSIPSDRKKIWTIFPTAFRGLN